MMKAWFAAAWVGANLLWANPNIPVPIEVKLCATSAGESHMSIEWSGRKEIVSVANFIHPSIPQGNYAFARVGRTSNLEDVILFSFMPGASFSGILIRSPLDDSIVILEKTLAKVYPSIGGTYQWTYDSGRRNERIRIDSSLNIPEVCVREVVVNEMVLKPVDQGKETWKPLIRVAQSPLGTLFEHVSKKTQSFAVIHYLFRTQDQRNHLLALSQPLLSGTIVWNSTEVNRAQTETSEYMPGAFASENCEYEGSIEVAQNLVLSNLLVIGHLTSGEAIYRLKSAKRHALFKAHFPHDNNLENLNRANRLIFMQSPLGKWIVYQHRDSFVQRGC